MSSERWDIVVASVWTAGRTGKNFALGPSPRPVAARAERDVESMSVTGRGGWRRRQRYASGRAPASGNEITHHELERFGRHGNPRHRASRPCALRVADHRVDKRGAGTG